MIRFTIAAPIVRAGTNRFHHLIKAELFSLGIGRFRHAVDCKGRGNRHAQGDGEIDGNLSNTFRCQFQHHSVILSG
jgi:hypothetical protein